MGRTVRFDRDGFDDGFGSSGAPNGSGNDGRKKGGKVRISPTRRGGVSAGEGFVCVHCKAYVSGSGAGTKNRNHCPMCLWSRHVDDAIGDRASGCRAPMEAIAVAVRGCGGEWCLVHRCTGCGQLRTNRVAGDDSERSLLALALRPLANPAFPLDLFEGPA